MFYNFICTISLSYVSTSRNGKRTNEDQQIYDKDDDRKKYSNSHSSKHSSEKSSNAIVSADNILPGASSLQDINTLIKAAKKEKLEQLKKKSRYDVKK